MAKERLSRLQGRILFWIFNLPRQIDKYTNRIKGTGDMPIRYVTSNVLSDYYHVYSNSKVANIAYPAISRSLRKLEKKKLVILKRNKKSGVLFSAKLTRKGKKVVLTN